MSFLSPWTMAIAAGLTVPPLVLLYFLKLRRQEVPISSTFLWKRAVQDLQVNAPFQRLRRNLLLLLQLVVLALAAAALGQPLLQQEQEHNRSLVILIDRSASMNVVEDDEQTRLDRAKREAIRQIQQTEQYDRAMVIAFSDRAAVMSPFSNNPRELERAVQAIEPTEGLTRLREAISLAEAHLQPQIVEREGVPAAPVPGAPDARAVLFSDGQVEDAEGITLERLNLEWINVATRADNVGIVSFQASRRYDRPHILNVVAAIENFGPEPVSIDVELFVEGQHSDIQSFVLGPGSQAGTQQAPAVQVVSFDEIEFAGSGVIEARLSRSDALQADNRAFVVVPPPRAVSVLLVGPGNLLLNKVLSALPITLKEMTPDAYEKAPDDEIAEAGRCRFDVVIFDGCTTARLPKGGYFFWGRVPQIEGFSLGEAVEYDTVFNCDESHLIMRHVDPYNVSFWDFKTLMLPDHAEILLSAASGPVLGTISLQGSRFLICAFGLLDDSRQGLQTNWPLQQTFVVFMYNAIEFLSGRLGSEATAILQPGDAVALEVPAKTCAVTVQRPDGEADTVSVGSARTAYYSRTDQVGLYRASPTVDGTTSFAVNLFSSSEGRTEPRADFVVGGQAISGRSSVEVVNVELWPWILLGVLAFLFVEWAVYSKRILV